MGRFSYKFDSFAEVEKHYETTPFINVRHKTGYDVTDKIVPLGDRKRKWERMVKIDDNTYAFVDYIPWRYRNITEKDNGKFKEVALNEAYIIWQRKGNKEYLRFRNVNDSSIYQTSALPFVNFVTRYGPYGMNPHTSSGHTYISINSWYFYGDSKNKFKGIEGSYFLPKNTRLCPFGMYTADNTVARANNKDLQLVFVRNTKTGEWSGPLKQYEKPSYKVDKKRKQVVTKVVKKFVNHWLPMMQMMGNVTGIDVTPLKDAFYAKEALEGEKGYYLANRLYSSVSYPRGHRYANEREVKLGKQVLNVMRKIDGEHAFLIAQILTQKVWHRYAQEPTEAQIRKVVMDWAYRIFLVRLYK